MTTTVLLIDGGLRNPTFWVSLLQGSGCEVEGPVPLGDVTLSETASPDLAVLAPAPDDTLLLECVQRLKILDPALPVLVVSETPELFATDHCGPFEGVFCLPLEPRASDVTRALAQALGPVASCNGGPAYPVIIGRTPALQEIRQKVRTVADKDIAVLITGESGTGKELIARAIHCHSKRLLGPLVKISCGALPDDLLESEVFGYQRGAFTGAYANKPGRLEMSQGGTLLLDEVGDLSLPLQVKFLQVLEEKVVSRLGGTDEKLIDARVVAATNADLAERVHKGEFRSDLFYRLSVIHIQAPPLRGRREDVPLLTHYFLHKYCTEMGRPVLSLPEPVVQQLMGYAWPGNVRELENLVRRAVVMQGWDFLDQTLGDSLLGEQDDHPKASKTDGGNRLHPWPEQRIAGFIDQEGGSLKSLVQAYTAELEREAVREVLEDLRWNRKKAAALLGVSYKTLLNRIASLNLQDS